MLEAPRRRSRPIRYLPVTYVSHMLRARYCVRVARTLRARCVRVACVRATCASRARHVRVTHVTRPTASPVRVQAVGGAIQIFDIRRASVSRGACPSGAPPSPLLKMLHPPPPATPKGAPPPLPAMRGGGAAACFAAEGATLVVGGGAHSQTSWRYRAQSDGGGVDGEEEEEADTASRAKSNKAKPARKNVRLQAGGTGKKTRASFGSRR